MDLIVVHGRRFFILIEIENLLVWSLWIISLRCLEVHEARIPSHRSLASRLDCELWVVQVGHLLHGVRRHLI